MSGGEKTRDEEDDNYGRTSTVAISIMVYGILMTLDR